MTSLVNRLRQRSVNRPIYTDPDSDDEFVPNNNQIIEHNDEIVEREPVNPLIDVQKILDCKMRPIITSNDHDDFDNVVPKEVMVKHYLVKWKQSSYLHCSWVPEEEFLKAYKSNKHLRTKVNKFHSNVETDRNKGEDFVAIRPEWTTVDRIIACRGEGDDKQYLVKFKELSYAQAYWEYESNISKFQKEIQRFMDIDSGHRRDKYVKNERNRTDFKKFDHTPEFLTGTLHPYQLEGLNFLRFSWSKQNNVILADEMGLGKTIQCIAFLASLFEENLAPFLVVAPLSTLPNWEREFATWASHMNVVMFSGNSHARTNIRAFEFYFKKGHNKFNKTSGSSGESKQAMIKFDVLLTSYENINAKDAIFYLKEIEWKCLVVDEGHRLKNEESKLFSSLKKFTTMHRVILTGTPLQNNVDELFVLMRFLDAEKFGSLENFQGEFKDISREEKISKLHRMLAPHFLRRLKKDVLKDMPSKKELILLVDMSIQQKEIYKAILARNFKILTKRRSSKTSNVLMELRKVCLHPYMVECDHHPIFETANEAYYKQLLESSGKLHLLDKMMVKLKEQGHRVLIYSQFQHMLNILEDYCTYKNWFYERLDGKVKGAERQRRIDRFNAKDSNRFCFLLSTRAGGLGINLATADTVIFYDSDWNPHVDLQAMARAHRLGQANKVMIYTLINRGTIEERMIQMAKKKMLLEHLVVGQLKTKNLTQEELDDIIRYGSKEIFSEGNEETETSRKIHYDDAAIEKLLDRDQVDSKEVSTADEKENEFLKAFKVANFEYIDKNEAAESEEAQAIENSDRTHYWKDLLKDKYVVDKAEELTVLGKRKRSCKKISLVEEDDDLDGFEESFDESYKAEPIDDHEVEVVEQEIPKVRIKTCIKRSRVYKDNSQQEPLMEGEGSSLKVLGFNKKQRHDFSKTMMRYGVGDYDWKMFVSPLKPKTYEEINAYAILYLQHLSENSTKDSPETFSDGVPREEFIREDVLLRISVLMLLKEKLKMLEDNPTKPVFSNRIYEKFPALDYSRFWKEEHDKMLLHAVFKHGYGKWKTIIDHTELEIHELICQHMEYSYVILSHGAHNALKSKASAYGEYTYAIKAYKEMIGNLVEFVKSRFQLLEEAMKYEYAEEYYKPNSSASISVEQGENVTNVVDTKGKKPILDQLPMTGLNVTEELTTTTTVAVDNKKERVEIAQSYNQICKIPKEPKENLKPLKSIFENLFKSLNGTGTKHGV